MVEGSEDFPEVFSGAVTFVRVAVEGFLEDRIEGLGELEMGIGLGRRGDAFVFKAHLEDLNERHLAAFGRRDQGEFACEHLVEEDGHRVEVGMWADLLVHRLFGGDIKGRAEDTFGGDLKGA